jgi:hypothetical protein
VPTNEYDAILANDGAPVKTGNEYNDLLVDDKASQKQSVQGSMYVAAGKQPDQQARVLSLAKELNVPADFVSRNYDKLSKKKAVELTD